MTRTVYLPLAHDPTVLFGLRLPDLVWVTAGFVSDLAIWRAWHEWLFGVVVADGLVSLGALVLAVARLEEASIPEWMVRSARFWLGSRLFLP